MALDWLWWRAWVPVDAVVAAAVGVAGVALGDIDLHFVAGVALVAAPVARWASFGAVVVAAVCLAGVALDDIDLHFAWQAWHQATSTYSLHSRRGTWRHRRAFCAAGMGSDSALGPCLAPWSPPLLACMAGVALGNIDVHPASQAWHLATSTFSSRRGHGTWRH